MTYYQPRPSARRLALLERRPRRVQDVDWREMISTCASAGGLWVPIALFARLTSDVFAEGPLGFMHADSLFSAFFMAVGAAGLGYVGFALLSMAVIGVLAGVFAACDTRIRQEWAGGFVAGVTAVLGTAPIAIATPDRPLDFLFGPVLATLLTQPATTMVAARLMKQYVRDSFWSADAQIVVGHKPSNLQISLTGVMGAVTAACIALGLLRLSGLIETPFSRVLLSGFVFQMMTLPVCVWIAHWRLDPRPARATHRRYAPS